MKRVVVYLSWLLDAIAAIAMLSLLLITTSSVLSRFIFSKPIAGALESGMLLMPIIVFGGMAWVFARVGHFAMTSFINARGGVFRKIALVLQCLLAAGVFLILSVEAISLFQRSLARGEFFAGPVNIPVYYSRLMIAVGSVATVVVIIAILLPEGLRKIDGKVTSENNE